VVGFIVFLAVFGMVLYTAMREQRWFKKILFYYFPKVLRPISYQLKPINIYYNKLTKEERKRFEWRVYYFLDTTQIVFSRFKPGQIINYNATRYLIASVATEMTLFLSEDCFDAFHKIIIYPDNYYSRITGQYHKGETNPAAGYIVLSWKSFHAGFENRNDGINLLMHEFAHALWLENKLFEYEIFDAAALRNYERMADRVMIEMTQQEEHFLRRYALTNREEFFAVTVENFFERPAQFKLALPELYQSMVNLLKQDPLHLK
jgi:MtfA peptidase